MTECPLLPHPRLSAIGGKADMRPVPHGEVHMIALEAFRWGLDRKGSMEYATFRKWLAEHGCRFDTQSEKRGEGHGTVTIHRAGRTAELPLVGASHNLDPRSVRQVCEALGLDWSKLPGPEGRV